MNGKRFLVMPFVLAIGTLMLYITVRTLFDRNENQLQLTQSYSRSTNAVNEQQFNISDKLRYRLDFNEVDKFSLYDEKLVKYVRGKISQPSREPRDVTKRQKTDFSQVGQSKYVDKLLSGRKGGFFIECGASNGQTLSNSLFFELERNWTGILIEANPVYYRTLLGKRRRSYVLSACLSTQRRPMTVRMQPAGLRGGIVSQMHPSHFSFIDHRKRPEITVTCFPLNTIMAALSIVHVDYLSLDVEGPELDILRTVDWTRLRVDVMTIEYRVSSGQGIDKSSTLRKLSSLRKYFRDTAMYEEVGLLPRGDESQGLDVVFSRILR